MRILHLFLLMVCIGNTQAQRSYYFVEVASQDSVDYAMEYGQFKINEGKVEKERLPAVNSIEDFIKLIEHDEKERGVSDADQFIYLHGMWGHQDWIHKTVLNTFEEDIFSESKPQTVISFIWHSGIHYYDNVKHALRVGKFFRPVAEALFKQKVNSRQVLAHSMGNRVFQGIYSELSTHDYEEPPIDNIFMIAADLEADIFAEEEPLYGVSALVRQAYVYVHNNDRSLGMSRSLNSNQRLGLDANANLCSNNECLTIIDVSTIEDNEGFGPALSNHRYFYTSPTVRNDLRLAISQQENKDRKELDHPRRLQLLPLESN